MQEPGRGQHKVGFLPVLDDAFLALEDTLLDRFRRGMSVVGVIDHVEAPGGRVVRNQVIQRHEMLPLDLAIMKRNLSNIPAGSYWGWVCSLRG